jgi:repressor LexA
MSQPSKKLTDRQAMVLDFIIEHIDGNGFPPTIREIGTHLEIRSTNGVNDHLKALERKGYLIRKDAKSRALKPLYNREGSSLEATALGANEQTLIEDVFDVPVIGRIAAGTPITAVENVSEHLRLGEGLLGVPSDVFGLVVRGESMIDDGILDGDYIFVRKQNNARDGEIVAVMVDGEATVKRLYREGPSLRLQPANEAMEPIFVHESDGRDASVLGKVIGVFRRL